MTSLPSLRRAALSLLTLALVAGCSRSGRGGPGDGSVSMGCTDGEHVCSGASWMICQSGNLVPDKQCSSTQVCTDAAGCTACMPGGLGCSGDNVVQCDGAGNPTQTVVETCAGTCVAGACTDACSAAALAKSNSGCVYYAVDLPNWGDPTPLSSVVASDQQFAVAVANPNAMPLDAIVERNDGAPGMAAKRSQVAKVTVPPNGLVTIPLPQREVSGFDDKVSPIKRNRSMLTSNAYRITTTRPSTVYQFQPINNPGAYSNDASLLIPQNSLDASYLVLGWPGIGDIMGLPFDVKTDYRSFFTIVASRDNTHVRVVPSAATMPGDNVPAIAAGKPYVVTLNEFDTLNIEAPDAQSVNAGQTDFTGTRIEADAPVAVWSGVECTVIGTPTSGDTCCCDHLEEQIYPRSSLGADYVAIHTDRTHVTHDPEYFRVMALDANTQVTTSLPAPDDKFTLMPGQMRQILATSDFTASATHPIEIGQFMVSQTVTAANIGDPSFMMVPPVAQHRDRYIFLVPTGYMENWALMAVPDGATVQLDGATVTGCDTSTVGTVAGVHWNALRCPIDVGAHTLSSSARFGLVIEGEGPGPVSYGYTGGMDFKPVNRDCMTDADCSGGAEFVCAGGACVPPIQ